KIGDQVMAHSRQSLDITDRELVLRTISEEKPDVVINCAAWTDVDGCEFDSERAFLNNAEGPENLALACQRFSAAFATISTDYVFDGKKAGFYTQADEPNPLSVYGQSKLAGEERARIANPTAIVVRTGYVFGSGGRNFLSTVIARVLRGEKLKAISDARGTPTFADDLAMRLRELGTKKTSGIFHVVNSGDGASFEDFVRLALKLVGRDPAMFEPVSVASLDRPAPRPANSCLRCLRSASVQLSPMPEWENALQRFVAREIESHSVEGGVALGSS
ncbi:MAG TPA: dTDP-4-dehydrorhamnose reductase, partial [Pyrinomonadaceae bacterium]|nr:dTDP-4-dehydrorhamnose reductase [Pyrinomonadaceae bacterium]